MATHATYPVEQIKLEIEGAIWLATVQSTSENHDPKSDLLSRLYESRDAVRTQQKEIDYVNLISDQLIASFSRFK